MSDGYKVVPDHICPVCGAQASLVRETRDIPFAYKGSETVIQAVHGEFCTACDESFCDPAHPADWERLSDEMDAFVAKVNAAEAERIRLWRKRIGLTQRQAAELFGGGINAFSEYERGKTQPSKSTVLLLKLLNKHPELLKELTN